MASPARPQMTLLAEALHAHGYSVEKICLREMAPGWTIWCPCAPSSGLISWMR